MNRHLCTSCAYFLDSVIRCMHGVWGARLQLAETDHPLQLPGYSTSERQAHHSTGKSYTFQSAVSSKRRVKFYEKGVYSVLHTVNLLLFFVSGGNIDLLFRGFLSCVCGCVLLSVLSSVLLIVELEYQDVFLTFSGMSSFLPLPLLLLRVLLSSCLVCRGYHQTLTPLMHVDSRQFMSFSQWLWKGRDG